MAPGVPPARRHVIHEVEVAPDLEDLDRRHEQQHSQQPPRGRVPYRAAVAVHSRSPRDREGVIASADSAIGTGCTARDRDPFKSIQREPEWPPAPFWSRSASATLSLVAPCPLR